MFTNVEDYKILTGFNIDDEHPHGDLDKIELTGVIYPNRETEEKKQLRGEDIAYLQEMYLRRLSIFNGAKLRSNEVYHPAYFGSIVDYPIEQMTDFRRKFSRKIDSRVLAYCQQMNAYIYSQFRGLRYEGDYLQPMIIGYPIKETSIPQSFPSTYTGSEYPTGGNLPYHRYTANDFNYKGESRYVEGATLSKEDFEDIFEDHLKQKKLGYYCNTLNSLCPLTKNVIKGSPTGSVNTPCHILNSNYYGTGSIYFGDCQSDIEVLRVPKFRIKEIRAIGVCRVSCIFYTDQYNSVVRRFFVDVFTVEETETDWVVKQSASKTNAQFRACGGEMGYQFREDYIPGETAHTGTYSERATLDGLTLYVECEMADYYDEEDAA